MKAYTFNTYGTPKNLKLTELDQPVPGEEEVLVRIYATAINDYDWSMVLGKPYLYRMMYGLVKPKINIPGMELSGVVEATGTKVTQFKKGDPVYGDTSAYGFGTYAEYISIHQDALNHKPEKMTFAEAASLSHAGLLALQGLKDIGKIRKQQKLLINGAGGGVGFFAFQIAKLYDAEVTGVDTGDKLNKMIAMGFDHIIDYKKENFTQSGKKYDLILDAKTVQRPSRYTRALKKGGTYVTVGGSLGKLLQLLLSKWLLKLFTGKTLKILALQPNQGINYFHDLFAQGKLNFVLDGPYPLDQLPEKLSCFGAGLHTGKIIINVREE